MARETKTLRLQAGTVRVTQLPARRAYRLFITVLAKASGAVEGALGGASLDGANLTSVKDMMEGEVNLGKALGNLLGALTPDFADQLFDEMMEGATITPSGGREGLLLPVVDELLSMADIIRLQGFALSLNFGDFFQKKVGEAAAAMQSANGTGTTASPTPLKTGNGPSGESSMGGTPP